MYGVHIVQNIIIEQCFSTFFESPTSCRLSKISRTPINLNKIKQFFKKMLFLKVIVLQNKK